MQAFFKALVVAGTAMLASSAVAQDGGGQDQQEVDSDGLDVIVVTATRRQESLQDVPVSVAVFDEATLERANSANSTELLESVANLAITPAAGSTNANIFLRGVGSTGISFNLQSGVGIYSDEVVLNSPVVNVAQLYDLERVEVLRGPQNTLYGRNTTGGAINFVSRKPDIGGPLNARAAFTYGRFDQVDLTGALGVPVGDNAALRLAFQSQYRDGIRRNLTTGLRDEERDTFAVRGQFAWEPTDRLTFNVKGHLERIRNGNLIGKIVGAQDPNDLSQPCSTPFELGVCALPDGTMGTDDLLEGVADMRNSRNFVDAGGVSGRVDLDFDNFTITSISAYEENSQNMSFDADGTAFPDFHFFLNNEQNQFTQELRATSDSANTIRWIVGAFYFSENLEGSTGPLIGTPMGTMVVQSFADLENRSYSAYGEVEFNVSDQVTVRAGGRYSLDEIEGDTRALLAFDSFLPGVDLQSSLNDGAFIPEFSQLESVARANGIPVFDGGNAGGGPNRLIIVGGSADPNSPINGTDFENWGATAGLDYAPSNDFLIYGKWSRGFKAGRFNPAPMSIATGLGDVVVEPETLSSFEVGVKSEFWDGRARLNLAAFYNDYKNQQINQFLNGVFTVTNVDSEIFGGEAELNLLPVEGLFVDASVGVLDTKVFNPNNNPDIGDQLPLAPELSGTLAVRHEWDFDDGSRLSLGADARYLGERQFNLANTRPSGEPYTVVNTRASYAFGDDREYTFAIWGKNIFDELVFIDNTEGFAILGDPATYGVTFSAEF
ncbi:MAG: TonB-dependent receptor [Pacificimonas sp.]|jgi:iron complex outermembrane receptor protein|nr:TonB-dependent receptor [Pacificimonas sp.]